VGAQTCTTTVPAGNVVAQTWTAAGSPYCVTGDIAVSLLTIEPGVEVLVDGAFQIDVLSSVTAVGEAASPITFKAKDPATPWRGLRFQNTPPGSSLVHCVIQDSSTSGITLINSAPTITDSTIQNNTTTGNGAGINASITSGDLVVERCLISANSARGNGGGIHAAMESGTFVLKDSDVVDNHAGPTNTLGQATGGGVRVVGNSQITSSRVLRNETLSRQNATTSISSGAGVSLASGNALLQRTVITHNDAMARFFPSGVFGGTLAVGGGLYLESGVLTGSNNTIGCNVTSASGGTGANTIDGSGVYMSAGTATLVNYTIARNNPSVAGGAGLRVGASANASVVNSIVYFNENDGTQIGGTAAVSYSNVQQGAQGIGNIDFNPAFAGTECADGDLEILLGSQGSIDKGNPDPSFNDQCFPPSLGSTRNDMGATGGPGACSNPTTTSTTTTTSTSTTTTTAAISTTTTASTSSSSSSTSSSSLAATTSTTSSTAPAPTTSTTAPVCQTSFADDFESASLAQWTVVGRQQGTGSASVVSRGGSQVAEVAHQAFTEIGLQRILDYHPDLVLDFDMEVTVSSQPPPASNYYASAGMTLSFLDASDAVLGYVAYLRATTDFVFGLLGPDPTKEAIQVPAGPQHHRIVVQEALSLITIDPAEIAKIAITAQSYGSTNPYPSVSGTVWFDNVAVGCASVTSTTTTTVPATSTTAPPVCGNGVVEADEQCDPAASSSPCVGRAPCKEDCQCPGNSCRDLPESAVCNDLNDCTDEDVCHARICGGVEKCRIDLPEEGPVADKKPTIPVTVEAAPEARCKVKLFQRVDASRLAHGAVESTADPLPGVGNGKPLAKVASGKIGKAGQTSIVLNIRLNKVAKKLLKQQASVDAVAEVTIKEKGGKKRLLRQLITLVRP